MSAGEHLDIAAGALAQAHALLRRHTPSPGEQATAAIARTRLFDGLQRQLTLLASISASWEPSRDTQSSPERALRAALGQSTATAHLSMPQHLPDIAPAGPVGTALYRAAESVAAASDLLAGNAGAGRARPPTPEGVALAAGHGHADSLAATAQLARAAADVDGRLQVTAWLTPGPAAGAWRPLLMAVSADVRRTDHAALASLARQIESAGDPARAPLRHASPVPLVDDPARWARIGSGKQAIAALDAARAWLLRNGGHLTAGQTTAAARAALAITHYAGHALAHTGGDPRLAGAATSRAAARWRDAGLAASALRSSVPPGGDHSTLTAALGAVQHWAGDRLRPGGTWRPAQDWAASPRQQMAWQRLGGELAARLPEIADLLNERVQQAQQRGDLLRPGLRRLPGHLIHLAHWEPAPAGDPTCIALRSALRRAGDATSTLAGLAGVARPPGLREAAAARPSRSPGGPAAAATPMHLGREPRGSISGPPAGVPPQRRGPTR